MAQDKTSTPVNSQKKAMDLYLAAKAAEAAERDFGKTYIEPLGPGEEITRPDNFLYEALSNPRLNRGLANIGHALVGEGTGSLTGDLLVGLAGGGAGIATELAGGNSGAIDWIPGGSPVKAILLGALLKNPSSKLFREAIARGAQLSEVPELAKGFEEYNKQLLESRAKDWAKERGISIEDMLDVYRKRTGNDTRMYAVDDYEQATSFDKNPTARVLYSNYISNSTGIPAPEIIARTEEGLDLRDIEREFRSLTGESAPRYDIPDDEISGAIVRRDLNDIYSREKRQFIGDEEFPKPADGETVEQYRERIAPYVMESDARRIRRDRQERLKENSYENTGILPIPEFPEKLPGETLAEYKDRLSGIERNYWVDLEIALEQRRLEREAALKAEQDRLAFEASMRQESLNEINRKKAKLNTFTNNPKKAAQEIVDAGTDIDTYLGDDLSKIRPGQRKAVEAELRKLGVDIPEEVVVKEKKVKKEASPKPVQLPKSEQQRIAARETALKTFKREPNKVYKSIEKGRDPADYFKGEVPEGFEQGYRDYLAAKASRKEAEAVAARQAEIDAENARQNAAKTEKQLEREQADAAARDEIARMRDEAEAARVARQAAYDARRPDAVLAAGWKPEEHPLYASPDGTKPNSYETIGGKTYPLTDREKRNLYVADSLAGEVLKSLVIEDAFRNADSRKVAADPNFFRHNENYTNYEKLWPHYKDKLDEARELGLFSDDVMTTKKRVRNKDGSMRDIDVDYLQLSHPQLPIMEGIYGMPGKESTLSLYDLLFRRRLDDELKAANPGYVRQLNVGEPGSRAYRVLNALKKR